VPDLTDGAQAGGRSKAALRAAVLARRRALPAPALAEAALAAQEALFALVRGLRATRVCAYVPVGAEPGGPTLPAALAAAVGAVLLPVLRADLDLDWATYDGALVPAGRGLREPSGPRLGTAAVATVDLVVVPALAVDGRGMRLGRGGGSYDRALARVPAGVPTVALLHDGEVLPAVPAEPHDRPVAGVIAPTTGLTWLRDWTKPVA
jgi:5-formyltetrahydrofolate cyclo-ligase